MHDKGLSEKDILEKLKQLQLLDRRYEDGKILGSMCTKPHPLAEKAYQMFFESNLGDSGLFPGSAQLEKEVINQLANSSPKQKRNGFYCFRRNRSKPDGFVGGKKHGKKQPTLKWFFQNQLISHSQKSVAF